MDNDNATNTPPTTFEASADISKLAEALAKAQGKMRAAAKANENPAFKQGARLSKYADLASVWDAWRAAGPEHGLAIVQIPAGGAEGFVTIRTVLAHQSGQWIASSLTMPVTKRDAQGVGSALTYCRRYALSAMVGVAPDDDDDGNAATGADRRYQNEPPPREQPRSQSANSNAPAGDSVELADLRRMIANAKSSAEMDRAKAYIQSKMPVGHPDRATAISEWTARDQANASAAKGAA